MVVIHMDYHIHDLNNLHDISFEYGGIERMYVMILDSLCRQPLMIYDALPRLLSVFCTFSSSHNHTSGVLARSILEPVIASATPQSRPSVTSSDEDPPLSAS